MLRQIAETIWCKIINKKNVFQCDSEALKVFRIYRCHPVWFAAVGSLHVEVRFWKMWFCFIFPPWRVNILGGLQSTKVVSKICLRKIIHLSKLFSLYFTHSSMVSNIGIEMDNDMSKLRPPVYMELYGFSQIKPFKYLIPNFDMCSILSVL